MSSTEGKQVTVYKELFPSTAEFLTDSCYPESCIVTYRYVKSKISSNKYKSCFGDGSMSNAFSMKKSRPYKFRFPAHMYESKEWSWLSVTITESEDKGVETEP